MVGSLVLALPVIWFMGRIYDWTEQHPSRRVGTGGCGPAGGVGLGIVRFKPVPEGGDLHFARDAYRSIWGLLGFFGGWFVERQYVV